MKVYYAHCMAIYDTIQEERDIALLKKMGFEVDNPNTEHHAEGWLTHGMDYATTIVGNNDILAFRALPDGAIPAGIYKEIEIAHGLDIPVFELPSGIIRRELSLDATREYLKELGQR
jgi:hypothetical protein